MNRFYANYSTLKQWESGNWQGAIESYFGLQQFTSRAMAEGKEWHKRWENETKKTNSLPVLFGGSKLDSPKTENYLSVNLNDWLTLNGVIDCISAPTIYEYKSGSSDANAYAGTMQPYIYQLLTWTNGILTKKAIICHYNKYSKEVTTAHIHLTRQGLEEAVNWVITLSAEMHTYLNDNDLYTQLMPQAKRETIIKAYDAERATNDKH